MGSDDPVQVVITPGVVVKPGDTLVLNTKESLSMEFIYGMRGKLAEYFESKGVQVVIVTCESVHVLRGAPDVRVDQNQSA